MIKVLNLGLKSAKQYNRSEESLMSSGLGLFHSTERFVKESTLPDAPALETCGKVRVEG